jgi:hypothetical protein
LKFFDRGDVRHHHAVAHCDAAGGTAEVGAAAGVEAAFLFERSITGNDRMITSVFSP